MQNAGKLSPNHYESLKIRTGVNGGRSRFQQPHDLVRKAAASFTAWRATAEAPLPDRAGNVRSTTSTWHSARARARATRTTGMSMMRDDVATQLTSPQRSTMLSDRRNVDASAEPPG